MQRENKNANRNTGKDGNRIKRWKIKRSIGEMLDRHVDFKSIRSKMLWVASVKI